MAHKIWIAQEGNGEFEVQPWNLPIPRDDKDKDVQWKNELGVPMTVVFPHPDPKAPQVLPIDPNGINGMSVTSLGVGEYSYFVYLVGSKGEITFIHHSDPKIIVK